MSLVQDALKNINNTATRIFKQPIATTVLKALPGTGPITTIATTPQLRSAIDTYVPKIANSIAENQFVKTQAAKPFIQLPGGLAPKFSPTIGQVVEGRIVKPVVNTYQGALQAFTPTESPVSRAQGSFKGATNLLSLTPSSLVTAPYEAVKSGVRAVRRGEDVNKAVSESVAGNRFTGLGDVFTDNQKVAQAANLAELPLMIAAGGAKDKAASAIQSRNLVVKKNYLEKVMDYKSDIQSLALRFEKTFGSLSDPTNPKMDTNLYDDAVKVWRQLHGNNRKTVPPKNIDEIIGQIKQTYQGAMTELRMIQEGSHISGNNIPKMGITGGNISSEGVVTNKGKLKTVNIPTQTEIKNRAEVAHGNPDLYTQRQAKWQSEPLPWETNTPGSPAVAQKTAQGAMPPTALQQTAKQIDQPATSMQAPAAASQAEQKLLGQGVGSTAQKQASEIADSQASLVKGITDKPGLSTTDKNAFADWVNESRAVQTEKYLVQNKFKDLDEKGLDAFFEVQKGNKEGRLADVRTFLNDKFKQARREGIDFNYQEDYLPQVWNNSPEEIAQAFGRRVTTKAGFTMEKVIEDYKTGIAAGLSPKFTKTSELLGWYEGAVNKAVADRKFMNYLSTNRMIMPAKDAPRDWVTVNPDRFGRMRSTMGGTEVATEGYFKAPRELAEIVNNYLFNPSTDGGNFSRGLEAVANYVSRVKNISLSFGIPFTAINSHGLNILARHTLFGQGGNVITRFAKGANYLVNQAASGKKLAQIAPELPAAIKKGLTIGVEDRKNIMEQAGFKGKFGEAWNRTFEVALFDKMIPALKYDSYKALVKDFSKSMHPDQAAREAAKLVNNVYGGVNWEQIGRDRNLQNFLRSVILAPDWAETTLRLGGNFAKSLKSNTPVARKYQKMVASLTAAYIGANMANKLSSGKFMWENDPGHTFEIEAGYTPDGQKRYLRPFGTAADMARLPYDMVLSLAQGDLTAPTRIIRNRLSIPAGVALGAVTDTDYRGRAIGWKGKDKYGNDMSLKDRAVGVGSEVASLIGVPSFSREFLKIGTGEQGVEQGLAQGFELPVRYSGGATSAVQKQVKPIAQREGQQGKQLYDTYNSLKGQSKFSDNQKAYIDEAGTQGVKDLLQSREYNHILDKVKKGETLTKEEEGLIGKASAAEAENPVSAVQLAVKESIARQKVKASGQQQQVGNTIFYSDDGGKTVTSVDIARPLYSPKFTGIESIDELEREKQISSYASKIKDVYKLYNLGMMSPQITGREIEKFNYIHDQLIKENAIAKKKAKGKAAGGSGKKRKLRALPSVKSKPISVRKIALPTVKLEGSKQFKVKPTKIKPLKISTPKKVRLKVKKGGIR